MATEVVAMPAVHLVVVAAVQLDPAEDRVRSPVPVPVPVLHPLVAAEVVLVAVVPVEIKVDALQRGRDVVVATAKSCSR